MQRHEEEHPVFLPWGAACESRRGPGELKEFLSWSSSAWVNYRLVWDCKALLSQLRPCCPHALRVFTLWVHGGCRNHLFPSVFREPRTGPRASHRFWLTLFITVHSDLWLREPVPVSGDRSAGVHTANRDLRVQGYSDQPAEILAAFWGLQVQAEHTLYLTCMPLLGLGPSA
jgi:hypothetical protein